MKQQRILFSVLFGIIALLAVIVMQPFLSYIVLAGILTYTLFPVYHFCHRRTGRAALSSAVSILVALLLMVLPAFFLISELVEQVSGAYNTFQAQNLQRVADYLSGLTGNRLNFQEMLTTAIDQIRRSIVGLAPDILGSIGELLVGLFIMFFVMYLMFLHLMGSALESTWGTLRYNVFVLISYLASIGGTVPPAS